jgi:hypothetical protein
MDTGIQRPFFLFWISKRGSNNFGTDVLTQ